MLSRIFLKSCRNHEQIVEEKVVIQGFAEGQQEPYDWDDVPDGSVDNHLGVKAPRFIVKSRAANEYQIIEYKRNKRVLVAKRILFLEYDYYADAEGECVPL